MEYFEPNMNSGLAGIESPDTSHSPPSPQGRDESMGDYRVGVGQYPAITGPSLC
jgi:hypothetical protein